MSISFANRRAFGRSEDLHDITGLPARLISTRHSVIRITILSARCRASIVPWTLLVSDTATRVPPPNLRTVGNTYCYCFYTIEVLAAPLALNVTVPYRGGTPFLLSSFEGSSNTVRK